MGGCAMKQQRPLTITNGRLVLPSGIVAGGIRLVDGLIEAVGEVEAGPDDERVDAKGQLIAPGLVDLGVFAIDKPAFHFGGITRAALMPDQSPPLDYPARVGHIAKSGKRSEEQTSELQSLMRISYAVFCLKNKTNNNR